eukprot:COSAG02_NODE_54750_length_294_cov_1.005128_1_plen_42_part_10
MGPAPAMQSIMHARPRRPFFLVWAHMYGRISDGGAEQPSSYI